MFFSGLIEVPSMDERFETAPPDWGTGNPRYVIEVPSMDERFETAISPALLLLRYFDRGAFNG